MRRNCPVCLQASRRRRGRTWTVRNSPGNSVLPGDHLCSLCVHFVFFLKWSVVTLLVLHAVHRCSIGSNMKNQQNRVEVSCGCRCITVRHRESSVGGSLPVCDPSHHTSVRTHHSPGPSDPVVVVESKHVNTMYHRAHRVIENP